MLVNRKNYNEDDIKEIESKIADIKPQNDQYQPVYNVFRMIVEELGLE